MDGYRTLKPGTLVEFLFEQGEQDGYQFRVVQAWVPGQRLPPHHARVRDVPNDYFEFFEDLAGVYLEGSWVLAVHASADECTFDLEVVLTPEHKAFHPPRPGEQYCYVPATLRLASSEGLSYLPGDVLSARDATGEFNWGGIDVFAMVDWEGREAWQLAGDWGELLVVKPTVTLAISSATA
jgi:hypothetical protein